MFCRLGMSCGSRFQSIAILDDEALLATCAHIELNRVAAGIVTAPETSRRTSIRQRVRNSRTVKANKPSHLDYALCSRGRN